MAIKLVVLCIAFLLFVASVAARVEIRQSKEVKITGKKHPLMGSGFFSRLPLDHSKVNYEVKPGFLMNGMRKAVASPYNLRAVKVEASPADLDVIGRVLPKIYKRNLRQRVSFEKMAAVFRGEGQRPNKAIHV